LTGSVSSTQHLSPPQSLPDEMRAVQLVAWGAEPQLREVPRPVAGPGEVLVKVTAAGLCHSDLHLMDWPQGTLPYRLPFTLGHENAGVVAGLGPDVNGLDEGDAVLVYGSWGCERCRQCLSGAMNLCENVEARGGIGGGLGFDGGLADYMVVPSSRYLVPIGDLDPVQAAPLTDAALSPYRAIKARLASLTPGSSTVVIGVGGLGHVAIRLLRALSPTRVIAIVGSRPDAVEGALRVGADAAFRSEGLELGAVRAELGSARAALVLDFVGVDETMRLAADLLGVGGHATLVGIAGGTFPMSFGSVPLECSVSMNCWGSLPELNEVVQLARSGALEVDVETVDLDDAITAYRRLREGKVNGRAVVVPALGA
jgi:alcohol dehydrogenase, propanol-preferring